MCWGMIFPQWKKSFLFHSYFKITVSLITDSWQRYHHIPYIWPSHLRTAGSWNFWPSCGQPWNCAFPMVSSTATECGHTQPVPVFIGRKYSVQACILTELVGGRGEKLGTISNENIINVQDITKSNQKSRVIFNNMLLTQIGKHLFYLSVISMLWSKKNHREHKGS